MKLNSFGSGKKKEEKKNKYTRQRRGIKDTFLGSVIKLYLLDGFEEIPSH